MVHKHLDKKMGVVIQLRNVEIHEIYCGHYSGCF